MSEKQRPFGVSMTEREMEECLPADEAAFRSPVPTQIVSNGEYNPLPQTAKQKQVESLSILVNGRKKHPAYRAIRPATGHCKPCFEMWQARQELEDLDKWTVS